MYDDDDDIKIFSLSILVNQKYKEKNFCHTVTPSSLCAPTVLFDYIQYSFIYEVMR